ncbi:MAG: hypothetical protein RSF81_08755, partial [Oscillospiraceae bacterium]
MTIVFDLNCEFFQRLFVQKEEKLKQNRDYEWNMNDFYSRSYIVYNCQFIYLVKFSYKTLMLSHNL